jgi:mono/diheme cytochrome c family protein
MINSARFLPRWPRVPAALLTCLLAASQGLGAEPGRFGLGRTPTAAEIKGVDIDVMPDGRGLPAGEGGVSRGEQVYQATCVHCHGAEGTGGVVGGVLAGAPLYSPAQLAADPSLLRTIGNYWPYATSLFDYIRRAMPFDRPGSLTDDEVYALTAYLLYLNGLVERSVVVDRDTLLRVEMPARRFFKPASEMEQES